MFDIIRQISSFYEKNLQSPIKQGNGAASGRPARLPFFYTIHTAGAPFLRKRSSGFRRNAQPRIFDRREGRDWGGAPINIVALWGPTCIVYRLLFHWFLPGLPKRYFILALVAESFSTEKPEALLCTKRKRASHFCNNSKNFFRG